MLLQKKLYILLVTVAVIPLLVVGFLSYQTLKDRSIQQITNQLISISSIQEKRVNEALGRYLGEVSLVTSLSHLRTHIKEYKETRNITVLADILQMIRGSKRRDLVF